MLPTRRNSGDSLYELVSGLASRLRQAITISVSSLASPMAPDEFLAKETKL